MISGDWETMCDEAECMISEDWETMCDEAYPNAI